MSFRGAAFIGDANFSEVSFQHGALFFGCKFDSGTDFSNAAFADDVKFSSTVFEKRTLFDNVESNAGGLIDFESARFNALVSFTNIKINGRISFSGCHFASALTLHKAYFAHPPDFTGTAMTAHLSLYGMTIGQGKTYEEGDEALYCRLKELAATARDHKHEQDFFAHEVRAGRLYQPRMKKSGMKKFRRIQACIKKFRQIRRWLRKWHRIQFYFGQIPGYIYEYSSNFGRSLLLPLSWLSVIWVSCAFAYAPNVFCWPSWVDFIIGLKVSTAITLPFLAASHATFASLIKADLINKSSNWLLALGFVQGLLALVFLFLIGLALRNRFRI